VDGGHGSFLTRTTTREVGEAKPCTQSAERWLIGGPPDPRDLMLPIRWKRCFSLDSGSSFPPQFRLVTYTGSPWGFAPRTSREQEAFHLSNQTCDRGKLHGRGSGRIRYLLVIALHHVSLPRNGSLATRVTPRTFISRIFQSFRTPILSSHLISHHNSFG
jgi:hypothetical protein